MREMRDWQTIESAPKDRTPMLLLSPDGEIGIGYIEEAGMEDQTWFSGSAAWIGTRRFDKSASVWLGGHKPEEATHWMPLPSPPSGDTL